MKDFTELAQKLNFLVAVQLENLSWTERVNYLWDLIWNNAASLSHQERQYDDFRKTSDELMSSLIELYFEALSWEGVYPFYEKNGHRWEVKKEVDFRGVKAIQDAIPETQALKAIEIFRFLPVCGRDHNGSEVPVFDKSRLILLNKVVEAWSTAESKEFAQKHFQFILEVLKVHSTFGRYGDRVVQALKDKTAYTSLIRLSEGLEMILSSSDLRDYSGSSTHNALEALQFRWVKSIPRQRLAIMAKLNIILDREPPPIVIKFLLKQASELAHLTDVARSFIDYSGKFLGDWEWREINPGSKTVELVLHVDFSFLKSVTKEMEGKADSWRSPDSEVQIIYKVSGTGRVPGPISPKRSASQQE